MSEIALLTDRQLRDVYFRPRDKHGQLIHESQAEAFDYKAFFWETWQARGWPERMIQAKWEEHCKEAAAHEAVRYGP
jgi:hypothetical protein